MQGQKIVSLLPAATEMIYALGLQDQLVGRSHECDFPPEVKALPVCTETKLAEGLSSAEIDTQVKGLLAGALSVYTVKREVIRELAPDVIITQDQCEACAVSLNDVEHALGDDLDKAVNVISFKPDSIKDIFNDIATLANTFGIPQKGYEVLEELDERVNIIKHKLKFLENKPTVACIEWLEPMMVSGNWIPELVEIAGGVPVLATAGQHSPYISWEQLQAADPDVIVLMPCGFSLDRTLKEVGLLLSLEGFADLKAIKNNRLYIADGNQYFNRPGPRIVDSLEILAEIINPKQFIFGLEGEGWMKFSV